MPGRQYYNKELDEFDVDDTITLEDLRRNDPDFDSGRDERDQEGEDE